MNNNTFSRPEMVINIKEIIWDLLEQWKTVLICSLAMMLLLAGAKYAKDAKNYAAYEEQQSLAQTGVTKEEQIAEVVESLSEDERPTIEYLAKQLEWIASEKEYLSNSILMNTNPTNQRTLIADYYIEEKGDSASGISALVYGYGGYATGENVVKSVGAVINPEANGKYIKELIKCDNESKINLDYPNDNAAILEVRIVLPEETDAQAVTDALTNALVDYSAELSKRVSPHSISLIKSGEAYSFNVEAVNNKNNVLRSVYDLTNNTKNIKPSLSDTQKAAVEQIEKIETEALKDTTENDSSAELAVESDAPVKPGISKKYALLGFALGAMLYALAYLILVILRRCVNCADDAEYYTQTRILGEIYAPKDYKGWKALFSSKLISRIRYRRAIGEKDAVANAAEAVAAACKHFESKEATVLCMTDKTDSLIGEIENRGIKVKKLEHGRFSEEDYLNANNVIFAVDEGTKIEPLTEAVSKCRYYGINAMGSIYFG